MRQSSHKRGYRIAAGLLLAGLLVLTSAGSVFAVSDAVPDEADEAAPGTSSYYIEKEHADLDYADMVYTGVDPHALDEVLAELDALTDGQLAAEDPEQRTVELYEEILHILEREYTTYVLGDIAHYKNVNDEEIAEKNRQDTMAFQDMSDAAFLSLQRALMGPCGDRLSGEFSEEQLDNLKEYEALTDRERELTDRETELQQLYDRLSEETYSFDYKGRTWTLNDLYEDAPDDYDDIVAIYLGISKAMDDALAPVYLDMVSNRKEIAEIEGYDNYTDYSYDVAYGRDFTGDDIAALRETVIEELGPLYEELRMMQYMSDFDTALSEPMSGEEILDTLGEHIGNVHPELTEAFSYLQEHGLYCIDNTENMLDVGFTSDLPQYGAAFIFSKTGGSIHDLETIVHEFGHFNASYHANQNVLTDSLLVDVAEIQSQGLEMLFLDEMQQILPDDPEGLQLYMVVNMLDSVLTGFEYDEFQQEVYAGEEMTVEELNRLAMDIDNKYTQYFYDDDGEAYEWVMINHTFSSPLYYIGYATSALSALDIWTQSLEDRDAAIDKYMKLSAVPPDMPYQEATVSCGLRNMLEPESIRELADEIRTWAGLEAGGLFDQLGLPGGSAQDQASDAQETNLLYQEDAAEWIEEQIIEHAAGVVLVAFMVGIGIRVLILIIALVAHFKKKRNDGRYGGPGPGYWQESGRDGNDSEPPGWR